MRLFSRFKKLIACAILTAFIPSQAWAQGITIPSNSSLNLNTGHLVVPGNITIQNGGALQTVTGPITLTGNWSNAGTFTPGTGVVNFSATSGTQNINSGGTAAGQAFYDLTHNAAGTVLLNSNAIAINDNFTNTAGTFNANSQNMNVEGNWSNSAAFTPGTGLVTLNGPNGSNQEVLGSTTFYNFSKINSGTSTLTFDAAGTQSFTNSLTMEGAASNLLNIVSTNSGTQAKIYLSPAGSQTIAYVNVQDSNAGATPTQQTLVGRSSPDHSSGFDNTNWQFGNTTITWTGATSTDWNVSTNWSPGLVPAAGDTVVIPGAPANQPVFSTDVIVGNLNIQSGASVNINGHNITVSTSFVNNGTLELHGNETTVSLTQDIADSGTFEYLGDGTSNPITIINFPGSSNYYNLQINDTNATKNTFVTAASANLTTVGNVTVTSGTLDISAHTDTLTVGGTLLVNGLNGALTATNGNIIANGAVSITAGALTAPGSGKTFDITGNFTHSGGTFTNSSGTVTLTGGNGTNQVILGATTFYNFTKIVSSGSATLTFDGTGSSVVQTFTNNLTLQGNATNNLLIRSSASSQAYIALSPGGTQVLNYLDVNESNASDGLLLAPNNSHDSGSNTNWVFGGTTLTWVGTTSTNWNIATNWDKGFVPRAEDSVIIANASNQPVLFSAVTEANLTINSNSSLTLSGYGLTVSAGGTFTNKGNLILEGTEALSLTQDTSPSDAGTFTYVGDGSGNPITIKDFGANDYYNLTINDAHNGGSSPNLVDTYNISTNALHVLGNLNVTLSSLDMSNGTAEVDGSVAIASGGKLIAPSATTNTAFTVAGNWSNAGTFTSSGGKVTFNGTAQKISGSSTFAYLRKVVTSADTLTLDHTATQTVSKDLTLTGAANPNRLTLVSDLTGHQAGLILLAGGTQTISDISVEDSYAGTTPTDLTLIDRNDYQNAGNNTNWLFGVASLTWVGGTPGALTDWNTASNWNLGVVPVAGDVVTIPGGTTYEPVLSTPVSVGQLTIGSGASASSASLTLNGNNLTVTTGAGNFINKGDLTLDGTETVSLTQDTNAADAGTFTYVGNGTNTVLPIISFGAPDYNNLVINGTNTFQTSNNITTTGSLTLTAGTLDISTHSNTLTVGTALTLGGTSSVLTATNGNIAAGSVSIASGDTLTAPASGSFNVAGNFTNNAGNYFPVTHVTGFNNSSGTVNFTTTATALITGSTNFYNFTSTAAGKTIQITAGSTQAVSHTLNLQGTQSNLVTLVSTGAPWNLSLSGVQSVSGVNVEGSDATNTVYCINCVDSHNNTDWVFQTLTITSPASGTTVGQTPTIIGQAPVNSVVYIRDISNDLVATTKSDANGNFRVVVGHDEAKTGLTITPQLALTPNPPPYNSLTPYLTSSVINPGSVNIVTVTATPTTGQVPSITGINCPNTNPICNNITSAPTQFISGSTPTLSGQGMAGAVVTVQARDANGNLILSAGSGAVAGNGTYSVTLTTALPSSTNYLSVTVGTSTTETTSALIKVALTDPFGVVYNSSTNQPIQGASVTLYNATTHQIAAGTVQSCNAAGTCCDMSGTCMGPSGTTTGNPPGNPFTTLADGFYSFLAPPGQYYINVSSLGYTYPSVVTTVPSGRTVSTGSKGQTFTVGSQVFEIDLPMDGNSTLLHITKNANKTDASVGDIVMYTVNIQNLSPTNDVQDVILSDKIPPGFKYIKDRVLLGGAPTAEPKGQRPLNFSLGTVPHASTLILQYQLVIGSGVTMGNYQNTATAQFPGGDVISNPAQASVKIIPDPVFDLGDVIGKVFFDWNENGIQDPPYYDSISHETIVEKPVPNVQIVMEDGTVITTDRDGKFNIPGLLPGRHLFRVDERTLPPGAYLTTDKAVIVDITAGSINKVNFGVNIDQTQTKGRDAVFFNEKIRLTQDRNRPVPRLNAAIFDASANAKPNTEEIVLNEGALVRQAEFRIFTNYSMFFNSWRLDIMDSDTRKVIRSFEGTPLNVNDPVYWNGRDDHDIIINPDHKYSYIVSVIDTKNNTDDTKEKPITIREIKDEDTLKKEREESKEILKDRADRYRKWLDAQATVNNLDHQLIQVKGETIHLDRQGTNVKSIHVMKGNQLYTDIPLTERYGLTPDELMAGGFSMADEKDNLEIILPNGDYTLDVLSYKATDDTSTQPPPAAVPQSVPVSSGMPSRTVTVSNPGTLEHYSRPLKVGDDYIMFVALGDAQIGYNIDRGNIEPIQDRSEEPGFYEQGKAAYYLKGQILGKYLVTSSFDTDRQTKALFRTLDPNVYYPVYGDGSTINYDAADTQGPLYLKVEWDKSQAILGNYAVDFNDTEFAAFSQKYYGGMIDYQSVSNNPYGDARTKIVVYHAQIQQEPSHNEFLATGGSLYFLKYKNVIQGSETVTIQVRDQTTGLVVASQTMANGSDYEIDDSQGSILFWQPVAMIAQTDSIISNNLINGDPIYVVVDYQYAVAGMQIQGSQGGRVAQAIGDNVVLGGTFVQDNSNGQNYTLEGTDATLHVDRNTTVKTEYAQTTSQETGSYVSTDGGITFTPLMLSSSVSGKAYGIKGDTRLFDNIGLKSYYKWVGDDFGATSTTSQQGKESMGLSMTWDMSPVTRLTASEDVQRLMAGANLQASTQVGASETDTTMVQVVHTAERLKLTGQFQLVETKSVINGVESTTNQRGATMGGQAQYDLTDRIKLTLGQQVDVINKNNTATTIGAADRVTDHTTLNAQEVFSSQGHALTAGVTNQLTKKIAVTTDYTLTNLNTGEVDKTASVGVADQVTKNITTTGTVAQTASSTGSNTTTASVGTKAKLSDNMTLAMNVGKTQNSLGQSQGGTSVSLNGSDQFGNTTVTGTASATAGTGVPASDALGIGTTGISTVSSFGVQATTKVDENNSTNGSVNIANETTGDKTTTVGFGNTSKIDQELQAVTDNSFSFSPDNGTSNSSKYGIVRNINGQKAEADYTKQTDLLPSSVSESNIYGLSGDVNDKLAVNGSIESGKVQNLNSSQTNRTDFTFGSGYVLKDTETAEQMLKNSIKLELRLDKGIGTDSLHQYVLYDALDYKITDNYSVNAKIDYSKTLDVTTGAVAERHQEIILGTAYRPVNFDKLNLIAEYSYQDGYGGGTQQADALNTNVNTTIAQVLSGEGVYDINDKWQAAEKVAYRIENEQDTGFAFTQTHTWLVIHRLNYKIDRNWTISGEYRDLVQVEAKDNKQGILLQATREINENTELSIGWNFTKYSDDLTNLSYTSLGPFVKMTGKFYDESPEEKARARAKWLDARINVWAWTMIKKELSKKDSKIMLELNRMFALAKIAQKAGRFEESHQIYKDIISAGQMMYDEASEYIRSRIAFEEQMQQLDRTARDYFKGGEYVKARKIWEKVVEDASKGVVK